MADSLSVNAKITLSPQSGQGQSNTNTLIINTESHTQFFQRTIQLSAGVTDFPVVLPADFATVAFVAMQTTAPFTLKYGATGNTPRTCRKCLIDTLADVAPFTMFFTTGTVPAVIELMVVGDK